MAQDRHTAVRGRVQHDDVPHSHLAVQTSGGGFKSHQELRNKSTMASTVTLHDPDRVPDSNPLGISAPDVGGTSACTFTHLRYHVVKLRKQNVNPDC